MNRNLMQNGTTLIKHWRGTTAKATIIKFYVEILQQLLYLQSWELILYRTRIHC